MKRRMKHATALALVVGAALAPTMASADPVVGLKVDGVPFVDGGTGAIGQNITVSGVGCTNPEPGDPSYMGLYLAGPDDEPTLPSLKVFESQVDEGGASTLEFTIDLNGLGTQKGRFYCSAGQADSVDGSSMLWVSPVVTMTIEDTGGAAPAARTASASSASVSSTPALRSNSGSGDVSVVIQTDPDELPLIDKIDITAAPAAALKAKVDAADPLISKAENFSRAFFDRTATDDELTLNVKRFRLGKSDLTVANSLSSNDDFSYTGNRNVATRAALDEATSEAFVAKHANENYVISTFRTLAGHSPSASEAAKFTAQLDDGLPRVQVIENIALTLDTASYWNVKAFTK